MKRGFAKTAGVLCAALASQGCGADEPAPVVDPPETPNIVLLLVDTLRADHLGAYGYERPTSPNLDAFAGENVLFESAHSQAPCTFPSVNSLLTSRSPLLFFGQEKGQMGFPAGVSTLPEMLGEAGYRTAAVSASAIVRKTPSKFNLEGGFDRGFLSFDETCMKKSSECVNNAALKWLDTDPNPGPFFLYLHYMEPHGRYQPPEHHERKFAVGYEGKDFIERGDPVPIAEMIYKQQPPDLGLTDADWHHLVALYDEEILYFDTEFARLMAELDERGLRENTIVVVASDHGEEFLEHGDVKHCRNVYDTTTRTPLLLRVPGVPGRVVAANAQNLDIVPTLLDYAGVAAEGLDGRSLRALAEGRELAGEAPLAFSAWKATRAVTRDGYKLISNIRRGEEKLFDLRADPAEQVDVAAEHPDVVAALRRELKAQMRKVEPSPAKSLEVGDEADAQLRELGYLE